MTYSGMVSRDTISDSVCLAFIITAFNYLDILSGDTQNVNLNAPTKEKVFFMLVMNGSLTKETLLLFFVIYMA